MTFQKPLSVDALAFDITNLRYSRGGSNCMAAPMTERYIKFIGKELRKDIEKNILDNTLIDHCRSP